MAASSQHALDRLEKARTMHDRRLLNAEPHLQLPDPCRALRVDSDTVCSNSR
jgi:hypothetical protein